MKKCLFVIAFIVLLAGLLYQIYAPVKYVPSDKHDVPLVRLLCNPQDYNKCTISVGGFLHVPSSGSQDDAVLFLHEDDCRYGMSKNAIFVCFPKGLKKRVDDINHRYVWLKGVFSASDWDRRVNAGAIIEVKTIAVLPCLFGEGQTNAVLFSVSDNGDVKKHEG